MHPAIPGTRGGRRALRALLSLILPGTGRGLPGTRLNFRQLPSSGTWNRSLLVGPTNGPPQHLSHQGVDMGPNETPAHGPRCNDDGARGQGLEKTPCRSNQAFIAPWPRFSSPMTLSLCIVGNMSLAYPAMPALSRSWSLKGWMLGTPPLGAFMAGGRDLRMGPAERVGQMTSLMSPAHRPPLGVHHAHRGESPAVLTPSQFAYHQDCLHLLRTLQMVLDQVGMPMWLLGCYEGMNGTRGSESPGDARCMMAAPPFCLPVPGEVL